MQYHRCTRKKRKHQIPSTQAPKSCRQENPPIRHCYVSGLFLIDYHNWGIIPTVAGATSTTACAVHISNLARRVPNGLPRSFAATTLTRAAAATELAVGPFDIPELFGFVQAFCIPMYEAPRWLAFHEFCHPFQVLEVFNIK